MAKRHKSALKAQRQNEKRRLRNRAHRSRMRTAIKKLRALIRAGQVEQARAALPGVYSIIDGMITKGIIKRNTAARYKSRLASQLNRLASAQAQQ